MSWVPQKKNADIFEADSHVQVIGPVFETANKSFGSEKRGRLKKWNLKMKMMDLTKKRKKIHC